MDDQQRAQSYLCNSPHTHRLMRPFPFHLLIGKFTYSALRKNTPGTLLQEDIIAEQAGWLGEVSWEDFAAISDPECPR